MQKYIVVTQSPVTTEVSADPMPCQDAINRSLDGAYTSLGYEIATKADLTDRAALYVDPDGVARYVIEVGHAYQPDDV